MNAAHRPAPAIGQRIADGLELLAGAVSLQRRVVHAGESIYQAWDTFARLHVLNAGVVKIVNLAPDGREQVVALKLRGDWLGLDGLATGRHGSDAIAIDTCEVWSFAYDALIAASARQPALLRLLHEAMGRAIARDRDALMSICTLPADARVAEFLRGWAQALDSRGLRTDQIILRLTRAEIGNHLGMTLESVSRALSKLEREQLIGFAGTGRREVCIPDVTALEEFVQRSLRPQLLQ
ncbi:MAG TPA: Crp/Fnr family transcriptional regulator [Burkholderiaceae bacterium]|nr:Crp/Fnr family transcriptional regulator [Burkholderiaceae bacterium]